MTITRNYVGSEIHIVGEYKGKTYTADQPYVIDLAPVEQLLLSLEEKMGGEEHRRNHSLSQEMPQLVKMAERMNSDQLINLTEQLLSYINLWAQLYQKALDNPQRFSTSVERLRTATQPSMPAYEKGSQE